MTDCPTIFSPEFNSPDVGVVTIADAEWKLAFTNKITFPGLNGAAALTIDLAVNPPAIWIDESLSWDAAARRFWDAVFRMAGQISPFGDA